MTEKSKTFKNATHRGCVEWINATHMGQVNNEPSLTVEGLSEPMYTILERFARGQTVNGTNIYYDSEINENFESEQPFKESEYDLSDLDIARANQQRVIEEIAETKRSKAAAQKLLDDEKLADEVLARRKSNELPA
ncbi:unnamed protein product, partial [Rotaria socialis]